MVGEVQLDDLLHASGPDPGGDAEVHALDAVLALGPGADRHLLTRVLEDGPDHLCGR